MAVGESRLKKAWESLSAYGLRGGIEDAILRWAKGRLKAPRDVYEHFSIILNPDRPAMLPAPVSGPLKINWFIPNVSEASGGLFNIFRTIQHLEQWGHKNRVYVVGKTTINNAQATAIVRKYYFPIQSEVEIFTGEAADSDAAVATSWVTAYAVRAVGNTARKFYFIQDLEYLFSAHGSLHEFAKETYRWGFYGITAGQWIADVLSNEFGMSCSAFSFSYDRETYLPAGNRKFPDGKKRVIFYARPSTEWRGYELGVLALSLVAKKRPDVEFVLVGFVPTRLTRLPFPAVFPGVLNASELPALYRSCTLALVLSHSNLSLLPLELMACGCTVVSNSGPNVEWLLNKDIVQLAHPTPAALADSLLALLDDESLRMQKRATGLAFAQDTDWVAESKKIELALYKGLDIPFPGNCHA